MNKQRLFTAAMGCALMAVMWAAQPASAARVQLPEGTDIKVRFPTGIALSSGKLSVGIPVLFYLDEEIVIGGKVIVEKGAEGTAMVKECVKASKGGKGGKLVIQFVDLATKGAFKTGDDARLKLSGEISAEGKNKKLLSMLFIAGLFIKGGQAELPSYQTYTTKIAETVILSDS